MIGSMNNLQQKDVFQESQRSKQSVSKKSRSKRVTLQQVADAAGVSRSAASFVMTGRTDQRISEATIKKVRKAAADLSYRPNLTAKTLRTGKSGTVGLVSDFIGTTSHANSMVMGALDVLRDKGKLLFTVDTQGDADVESKSIKALLDRQVDGVIYAAMFTREAKVPAVLRTVPTVLLNCLDETDDGRADSAFSSVVPDEYQAGCDASRLLLEAGHTDRIVFAGCFPEGVAGGFRWGSWGSWALPQRLQGINDTLRLAGYELFAHFEATEWEIDSGRTIAHQVLASCSRRDELPTAIICVNDAVAFGMMQVLLSEGVRIPEDVSLISFDGSDWAAAMLPPITTLRLPQLEMGSAAARMLLEQKEPAQRVRISMPLVQGATVSSPRK